VRPRAIFAASAAASKSSRCRRMVIATTSFDLYHQSGDAARACRVSPWRAIYLLVFAHDLIRKV
jgi:NaMN:DMB phosphoribosyltransferase